MIFKTLTLVRVLPKSLPPTGPVPISLATVLSHFNDTVTRRESRRGTPTEPCYFSIFAFMATFAPLR